MNDSCPSRWPGAAFLWSNLSRSCCSAWGREGESDDTRLSARWAAAGCQVGAAGPLPRPAPPLVPFRPGYR